MRVDKFVVRVANPYFLLVGSVEDLPRNYLQRAIKFAISNKVFPLFYEGCLKYGIHLPEDANVLMRMYEKRRKMQLEAIKHLLEIRERYGIELMFFKTFKPFRYVPDDVDILLRNEKDLSLLINILKNKNYFIAKIGTPEIVLRRIERGTYVDLDIHTRLAVGHLDLFRSENLWRSQAYEIIEIGDGYKAPKLSEEYEVVREAAYSLLKDFNLSIAGFYLAINAMMRLDLKNAEEIARAENLLPHLHLYLNASYFHAYEVFGPEAVSNLRYELDTSLMTSKLCRVNRMPYPYPVPVIVWAYTSKAWLEIHRDKNLKVILQILKQPSSKGIDILLNYFINYFRKYQDV